MTTSKPRSNAAFGVALFCTAIFAAAFLIFAVQPMVGKRILPWFGGAPGVWTLCLAFYQSTLFFGYAYAYALVAWIPPARQVWVHAAVLLGALWVLPVLPDETWKPEGATEASGTILAMLVSNVALPFLLLASTGPLVQAWFSRAFPSRSPYPLYAVSNFGSLLALISYPIVVEPTLALPLQASFWSWSFAATGVAVLGAAWWGASPSTLQAKGATPPGQGEGEGEGDGDLQPARIALWILFPACAVALFMAVTNKLCLDVASFPFLWIVPLSIYLATLILCFGSERLYRRGVFVGAAVLCLAIILTTAEWKLGPSSWQRLASSLEGQIGLYSLALFFGCMVAHGELYRLRPSPRLLTAFYLCGAGGGALGGLFVGVLAPRIFDLYRELPIAIAACGLLVVAACGLDPKSVFRDRTRRAILVVALGTVGGAFILFGTDAGLSQPGTLHLERNFFGILRVQELPAEGVRPPGVILRSGTTIHGVQYAKEDDRRRPTSYYGVLTGVGLAMTRDRDRPMKLGVIGLGVGTLAAYGRSSDEIVFYELDPDVVRLARDAGYFSFLADSVAEIEIVEGDARLSLEAELRTRGGRGFDILVVDAFSSDAIPVHLLTREAFELYTEHLAQDGLLAVHVTNRNLKLRALAYLQGTSLGLKGVVIRTATSLEHFSGDAQWVIFARNGAIIDDLIDHVRRTGKGYGVGAKQLVMSRPKRNALASARQWTDDYSDVFGLLNLRGAQADGG